MVLIQSSGGSLPLLFLNSVTFCNRINYKVSNIIIHLQSYDILLK